MKRVVEVDDPDWNLLSLADTVLVELKADVDLPDVLTYRGNWYRYDGCSVDEVYEYAEFDGPVELETLIHDKLAVIEDLS